MMVEESLSMKCGGTFFSFFHPSLFAPLIQLRRWNITLFYPDIQYITSTCTSTSTETSVLLYSKWASLVKAFQTGVCKDAIPPEAGLKIYVLLGYLDLNLVYYCKGEIS